MQPKTPSEAQAECTADFESWG